MTRDRNVHQAHGRRRSIAVLVPPAMLLAASAGLFTASPASATTRFTVTSTADGDDLAEGDGVCDANPDPAVSSCTLRAAIEEANKTFGVDTIAFDIPGSGSVRTIAPRTELPEVTNPVVIDGYTQPGARPNTKAVGTDAVLKVELTGLNGGVSRGLTIVGDGQGSVVRGLVINRFVLGIEIESPFNTIAGNFIGTDITGTQDLGNSAGVFAVSGFPANFNTVGGTAPGDRNLVSGNVNQGVTFRNGHHDNTVAGNLIGTDRSGTAPLGNGSDGVEIALGSNNTIGGANAGAANIIAFNGGRGVTTAGPGTRVSRNSIFENGGPGISGVGDAPVLTSTKTADGKTTITGNLSTSAATATFNVELFSNPPGREDEGQVFLGTRTVTTDAGGTASFSFTTASAVPDGHSVTATAIAPEGDTSSFSAPRVVSSK